MPVITGAATYPHGVLDTMQNKGIRVDALDALTLAREAGSSKAVNIVLMGRLSTYFADIAEEKWLTAIEQIVKPAFVELNKAAFKLGRNN